jgi:MoaD family protein
MRIKVQYLGPVRVLLNRREEEIEISLKTTICELLKKLSITYGKEFEWEVFEEDGEKVREGLIVTVNGIAIGQLNGLETNLKLGDTVALLPHFAGGG